MVSLLRAFLRSLTGAARRFSMGRTMKSVVYGRPSIRRSIRPVLAAIAVLLFSDVRPAYATAMSPFIDVQGAGLAVVEDGAGLRADGTATIQLTIPGTVRAALLYWNGRDLACPEVAGACVVPSEPYLDQQLIFDGTPITGTLVGTEEQPTLNINNIGYFADVTSLVSAGGTGLRTFAIADGNAASNLDVREGISLVVLYTDATDPAAYRVILWDGLDFAWASDPDAGATRETTAATLNHGAQAGTRAAELFIIAGDGDPALTEQIDVSGNPPILNTLDSTEGIAWDSESYPITIAGGAASTTVQLLSNGASPDEFLWEVVALRVVVAAASPTIQLSSPTYSASEDSGTATVTVTRSSGAGTASVTLSTSDGTATTPGDYASLSTLVNFADGVTSVDVSLPLVNDATPESSETFNVTLTAPSSTYLLGTPSAAEVTILDTDVAMTIQLSSPTYSAIEESGTATVTVTRSSGVGSAFVTLTTSNGTATTPGDYAAVATVVNFGPGVTSVNVSIPLINDAVAEGSETFNVTLSAPGPAATLGTPAAAVVTILDGDAAAIPTLSPLMTLLLTGAFAVAGGLLLRR